MGERKVFCEECRNDVEFTVANKQMEGTVKGETYTYLGKAAYCIDCGSEIYVKEINDFNLNELYDKYRNKQGTTSKFQMVISNAKQYDSNKNAFYKAINVEEKRCKNS